MKFVAMTGILLVLSASGSPFKQERPNFAGKWVGRTTMVNLYGVVGPQEMTIKQDASTLTIDRAYGRNRVSIVLELDGTEATLLLDPGSANSATKPTPRELRTRAIWQDQKLKVTTTFRPSGASRDAMTIETFSLKGEDLIIERSDEAVGVGQGPLRAGMMQGSTLTYKRASK